MSSILRSPIVMSSIFGIDLASDIHSIVMSSILLTIGTDLARGFTPIVMSSIWEGSEKHRQAGHSGKKSEPTDIIEGGLQLEVNWICLSIDNPL